MQAIINVCEIIGYDRVIYASDYPFGKNYLNGEYNYSDELNILKHHLSGENGENVFHKNIESLLNKKEEVFIRRAKNDDVDSVVYIFNNISDMDRKFLAYNNKATLIKQIIRSGRHCYLAVHNNTIVGFLRESGRPGGFSLLEEIVVLPEYRGKGVATKLLKYYHNAFDKNMAKTNSSNKKMISLLCQNYYKAINPDGLRIINWIRNGE